MTKYIVIGDVHGCIQELHLLLHKYGAGRIPVFVGDLVDKGPSSLECVQLAMVLNAPTVKGNHDENHVRYHGHELRRLETGKANPMKRSPSFRQTHLTLLSSYLPTMKWLSGLPSFYEIPEYNLVVVHGGLLPGKLPAAMDPKKICRVRNIKPDGSMASLQECDDHPEYPFWADLYDGPQHVVYGHSVFDEVYITGPVGPNQVMTYGIDTGCVYGNKLSALLLPEFQSVSVKARRAYAARHERE